MSSSDLSPTDPARRLERIFTDVYPESNPASVAVANEIVELIRSTQREGRPCVLGLATGSTPTGVYDELVRQHQEDGLSFKNVVTFNLDEYFPMQPGELQSYVRFMKEHLFDHVDIDPANVHIPDGTLSVEEVPGFCRDYEQQIEALGGIDLQLLGIGRTGHIGFNEPGSTSDSTTRLIWLDRVTRMDAASDFFGQEHVPTRAITMGVGTILAAKRVVIMAFGENKAPVVARAVEGEVTAVVAASFLQDHPNTRFVMDQAAAAALTRFHAGWLVGTQDWTPALIRRATISLAQRLEKPILKLTDEDYNEHGLQELMAEHGPAYSINLRVFRDLQNTITGWPGGRRPEAASSEADVDSHERSGNSPSISGRRATDDTFPKRCLIFSPHPDDDVISMGGTLIRLVDQGHDVNVAYQVSGNIAVFDEDAIRFADFFQEFNQANGIDPRRTAEIDGHIETFLKNKAPGEVDSTEVQLLKGLIRRGEARAAGRACGLERDQMHFMDLPFYETGTVRKKPHGAEDINLTIQLLRRIQPQQVYAAGDLSDPHGTHRTCLRIVCDAIRQCRSSGQPEDAWAENCIVWLYRGAWQEWEPERIEMAVPISPEELTRKRQAIFKHESQKDKALFPGNDPREFWQRAEDRNRATATVYDKLGLAEYEAIEAFVQWVDDHEDGTVPARTVVTKGQPKAQPKGQSQVKPRV